MDSRIKTTTKPNRKQKQKRRDHLVAHRVNWCATYGTMGSLKRRGYRGLIFHQLAR
jgi:hypothetical protein